LPYAEKCLRKKQYYYFRHKFNSERKVCTRGVFPLQAEPHLDGAESEGVLLDDVGVRGEAGARVAEERNLELIF
jgi:hypothetical protein